MIYARLYKIKSAKINNAIKYKTFIEEVEYKDKEQIYKHLQDRYYMIEDLSDLKGLQYKFIFYCFDADRNDNMIADMIGIELIAYE